MPTYRSITLSLISQFDILTIPEYAPPSTPADPFSNAPALINQGHSLVSVYIPTYPSSQFWISYSISPPHPPKLLYYFKLYINGNLIVSWGCGEEDGYKGKTMFGLFASGRNLSKSTEVERRILCFGPDSDFAFDGAEPPLSLEDVMEVKVFRSKGRKRIAAEVNDYDHVPSLGSAGETRKGQQPRSGNIELVNAGILPRKHPQRYYKYALLDPLDQPFATFRYYYRTWDQLEALGVISPTPSIESSSLKNVLTERPLSPESSNTTIDSSSRSNTSSMETIAEEITPPDPQPTSHTHNATEHRPKSTSNPNADATSASPNQTNPTLMLTPPTPTTPNPSLGPPPATHSLHPTPSRESFTALVRTRPSTPDPERFKLNPLDPPRTPSPVPPVPRSGSMGVLRSVVNHAVNRRGRGASGSEASSEGGSVSEGGSEEGGSKPGDETSEGMKRREKKGTARGAKDGKGKGKGKSGGKERDGSGGKAAGVRRTTKEGRKLNLWEEL